jgi:FdhD protein
MSPKPKARRTFSIAPGGARCETERAVAGERAVSITYNGEPHAVMMASPGDLQDFAIGFSLGEGIVANAGEIAAIVDDETDAGILLHMEIPPERFEALKTRRRHLVGQTACGLCGVAELTDAARRYDPITEAPRLTAEGLFAALAALPHRQTLNRATGAVHAAVSATADGQIRAVREDVGRHNAFDKLIGHMARTGIDPAEGFALLTSRCSVELVQKALAFRFRALVTVSAPTDLAITLAGDHDLTLVALARADGVLCFNDPFGIFA